MDTGHPRVIPYLKAHSILYRLDAICFTWVQPDYKEIIKSKGQSEVAFSNFQSGDGEKKICNDAAGKVSLPTVKRWVKMIRETGTINLKTSPSRPRLVRTKKLIQDVKKMIKKGRKGKNRLSIRNIANNYKINWETMRRVLRDDLAIACSAKPVGFINRTAPERIRISCHKNGVKTIFQASSIRITGHQTDPIWILSTIPLKGIRSDNELEQTFEQNNTEKRQ